MKIKEKKAIRKREVENLVEIRNMYWKQKCVKMENLISGVFVSLTSWRRGHSVEVIIVVYTWRLK